jgi:hypothetical protein
VTRPTRGLRSGRDRRLDTPESATYPIAPVDRSPRAATTSAVIRAPLVTAS